MDIKTSRTWAEISRSALLGNLAEIRAHIPAGCGVAGLVKADAYGHGAVEVARVLREGGCRYLAVACPAEAFELRDAGETLPILILGASDAAFAPALATAGITQAVESLAKAKALSAALRPGQRLKIHIKLDTGMGRLGLRAGAEETAAAIEAIRALPGLETEGLFTHFAVSDEADGDAFTERQKELFLAAAAAAERASGRIPLLHCANSGAVVSGAGPEGMDLVRPGILLYGVAPETGSPDWNVTPVMSLKSRISAVTEHKKGDTVSYGRTWTAERDCRIAVLPAGYADGLHRSLSGRAEFLLRGKRVPQIGKICMDMCMLDVSAVPDAAPGDEVTIFGSGADGGPTAAELAEICGTIPYELMCAVSPRVPRLWTR